MLYRGTQLTIANFLLACWLHLKARLSSLLRFSQFTRFASYHIGNCLSVFLIKKHFLPVLACPVSHWMRLWLVNLSIHSTLLSLDVGNHICKVSKLVIPCSPLLPPSRTNQRNYAFHPKCGSSHSKISGSSVWQLLWCLTTIQRYIIKAALGKPEGGRRM